MNAGWAQILQKNNLDTKLMQMLFILIIVHYFDFK